MDVASVSDSNSHDSVNFKHCLTITKYAQYVSPRSEITCTLGCKASLTYFV